MKILYLYAEVMGYTLATIRELVTCYGAEVHVVYWDKKKLTPFDHNVAHDVAFYPRSQYSFNRLRNLAFKLRPELVVCSGWMDYDYLRAARVLRQLGVPVVAAIDSHWKGGVRQRVASFLGGVLGRFFSHAWVAGVCQFEYARRLGFAKERIVFDLYSADISLFENARLRSYTLKREKYPHQFLFVGRLELVKGIDLLLDAWQSLGDQTRDWKLVLIGNGALKPHIQVDESIVVKDFMQPSALVEEIGSSGCFVLPSRDEPWGVVLHEFAAAGMPLICSSVCGSARTFLIHGENGYYFQSGNVRSLSARLLNVMNEKHDRLLKMGERSSELASRITPATSAANIISLIK